MAHRALGGLSDLEFEVHGVYASADGSSVTLHWRARATHRGEFVGLPPTGRRVDVDGADFHEYRDGLMWRVRGIYDNAELVRQLTDEQ